MSDVTEHMLAFQRDVVAAKAAAAGETLAATESIAEAPSERTAEQRLADLAPYRRAGLKLIILRRWDDLGAPTTKYPEGEPVGKAPRDPLWRRRDYPDADIDQGVRDGWNVGYRMSEREAVVDYDPRNDPDGSGRVALRASVPPGFLESCPHVVTGSGGDHWYVKLERRENLLANVAGMPGVELKGFGRQVVAAGSRHPNGRYYEWDDVAPPLTEIPTLPSECALLAAARRPEGASDGGEPGELSPEQLAVLLAKIDPAEHAHDYDTWLKSGMAAHHATGGLGREVWKEWSARDEEFADHGAVADEKWASFSTDREGSVTILWLFDLVKKVGGSLNGVYTDEFSELPFAPHEITLSGRQRDEIAHAVVSAVTDWNRSRQLFRHGGRVVLAHPDERGAPTLREQTPARFLDVTARAANFYAMRVTGRGEEREYHREHARLPQPEAGVALERLTVGDSLPPLLGTAEAPVMRPDGSILDRVGYDAATGLFAAFEPVTLDVPEHPTRAQIVAARDLLLVDLFGDFPYVDEASRAHALAALLTVSLRPLVSVAPMFAFDAPAAGSGKGLHAESIGYVALGRLPTALALPDSEEELRKTIVSQARAGKGLVWLDNVVRPLDSASLCALLTSSRIEGRILGVSEMAHLDHSMTWFVTGNNLEIRGDLVRRVVWCRIDPKVPNPEERTGFRHDLPRFALEERPRLLSAAFTLARAWVDAGRPAPSGAPAIGGFSEWAHVVGGCLEVAQVPGFLRNWADQRAALDDAVPTWAAFVAACAVAFPEGFTVKALTGRLRFPRTETPAEAAADADLRDCLPDELGSPAERSFARALGDALRKRAGQRFALDGGRVTWVEKVRTGHGGAAVWRSFVQG